MKITFLGAAKTVTGSCYLVQFNNKNFLVDCGMFQGHSKENEFNEEPFPFNAADIDYILLTHSHIDHSGRIPKIYKDGFRGQVICTKATHDLCQIMLPDSGFIQEHEAEWKNRKLIRAGKSPIPPMYTAEEAMQSLKLFKYISYYEDVSLSDDLRVRFLDAGHILGSSILEIWVRENGHETKIVFSGDLGNNDLPILRAPDIIEDADYLIIESTYGNRLHSQTEDRVHKLMNIMKETIDRGGNVIIPSFAVGRTQEIIYEIHKFKEEYPEYVKFLNETPVYIDSPLAISATEVFRNNLDCFDEEAQTYVRNGDNPLDFPGLKLSKSADDSKALNEDQVPKIIISASGMCEAGRIRHHLKHNLWKPESSILFVGYQAVGTLGRRLTDGAKKVKLFGEEISVNAKIEVIEGYSGHADQNGLIDWVKHIKNKPKKVFIVHGEPDAQEVFSKLLDEKFGFDTVIPEYADHFDLTIGDVVETPFKETKDKFIRLQLLSQIEILQEQADFIGMHINQAYLNNKSDEEIEELQSKLSDLDRDLVSIRANLIK
ncbi:MAG TPA: MBL fold hydrolase [Clostridiales bacterium]|nr:MAG: MBL fold hydrolase [Clostridiales bacterium GWD2_32_59]HAN09852.1 MBL fold hydrolase [Clostridiales bacterium]